ncbi:MAG: hypothetical protein ABJA37_07750 [Ferruginibacter sp.]
MDLKVIALHPCPVTGYSFAIKFSREQMLKLADFIPAGNSILNLKEIANKFDIQEIFKVAGFTNNIQLMKDKNIDVVIEDFTVEEIEKRIVNFVQDEAY